MIFKKSIFWVIIIIAGCAGLKSHVDFYQAVRADLKKGDFFKAQNHIDAAKKDKKYLEKDRVLYYLDKGTILHYAGDYQPSNKILEDADQAMEELFTKSISKAALSLMLNDNVLEYDGEIFDNIYVNIFKALNYIHIKKFDDALVEVNRINDKLRVWEDKYSEWVDGLNSADSAKIQIENKSSQFYDDVLAHYLSYLIYRADGEYDNSRISYEKMQLAWNSNPDIYYQSFPGQLDSVDFYKQESILNIMAFTGNAPRKYAVGGQITTYKDAIHFSDLTYFKQNEIVFWDGIKQGYHFKFSFPDMEKSRSEISRIEVVVDNQNIGELELLEDMGQVAVNTFNSSRHVIYFKTLIRTIIKGLASEKGKEKLRKEAGAEDNLLFGAILNFGVDLAVDATENPDLRSWRTLPQDCYIGEYDIGEGKHQIELHFLNSMGSTVKIERYPDYLITPRFNLLEAICLN